jgi:nitroreductase/NAD-dependent dihydropyrimidine dehydrogenase PreA subunit
MGNVKINKETCIGCGLCVEDCSRGAIILKDEKARVNLEACNECGHCVAVCPQASVSMPDYDKNEIIEFKKDRLNIDPDEFLYFQKFRRSVRQFKNMDVEADKLNKIIEAGRYSPTASNRQLNRFIIIKDKIEEVTHSAIKTLYDIAVNPDCDMKGWSAYRDSFIRMYEDFNNKKIDGLFFNAPAVIAITSEEKSGFAGVNAGIAASRMELQAVTLGLGVCYIGFFKRAADSNSEIKKLIGMKDDEELILSFVLGYPNVKYQRTVNRKPADVSLI